MKIETKIVACSVCGSASSTREASGHDYVYQGTVDEFQHVKCSECGHIFLNPQPTISSLPLMYPAHYGTFSNRFRAGASLLGRAKTAVNLKRIDDVLRKIPPKGRVLDVGCGNGELLLAIHYRRPDLELHGLDWHFPPETQLRLDSAGINLIEAPLEDAALPGDQFDLILMLQLIEHLWEPEQSLIRLTGALRLGGLLLVETPNTDGWDRRFFKAGSWGGYYFPRHLNLYNDERLAALLTRAGLIVRTWKSLPAPLIWSYSLQACAQRWLGWKTPVKELFGVKNLAIIAGFAALDIGLAVLGVTTSNQQMIAQKT